MMNFAKRPRNFQNGGVLITDNPLTKSLRERLVSEYRKVEQAKENGGHDLRYHELSGVHNPWGKSAHLFDSWALLDVCQSTSLVGLVTTLIGPDVVLWESRFADAILQRDKGDWGNDAEYCPVQGQTLVGVTVRIPIADVEGFCYQPDQAGNEKMLEKTAQLPLENILVHDIRLNYRYQKTKPRAEYLIHYVSADCHLSRDQQMEVNVKAMNEFPLINYTQLPIWLVSGEDRADNDFSRGFSHASGQWATNQ